MKDKRDKKERKEEGKRLWANPEFKDLIGKDIVVVLRTGVIVYGLLVEEGKYHLVLANAKVVGKTHEAQVVKIIINKGYMAMVHTKPLSLKKIGEEVEEGPLYPKNLEKL